RRDRLRELFRLFLGKSLCDGPDFGCRPAERRRTGFLGLLLDALFYRDHCAALDRLADRNLDRGLRDLLQLHAKALEEGAALESPGRSRGDDQLDRTDREIRPYPPRAVVASLDGALDRHGTESPDH